MVARAITHWMVRQNVIHEEDEELYEFALQSLFYSLAPFILSLFIGTILGQVRDGIVLSIPLCFIRKYSGGYHAPYGWMCMLISVSLLLVSILIQPYVQCNVWLLALSVLAFLSLSILSPIDSKNRPLEQMEKRRYKKSTIIMTLSCEIVYLCMWVLRMEQVASVVAMGIILAASLQLPCIPKLLKKTIR